MASAERGAVYLDAAKARKDAGRADPRVRLPAFGKELLELRERGLVPVPHAWWGHVLVCLDSWQWATYYPRLVVPLDTDPAHLDFSMLAGLNVSIVYRSSVSLLARRDALITRVVRAGAASLFVNDLDEPSARFIVKSLAAGLERREYA